MDKQILEELQEARSLVASLAGEIDFKNQKLLLMEKKCDDLAMENNSLHQACIEGMREMQSVSRYNAELQQSLEYQRNEYEQKVKELEEQAALRRSLESQRNKFEQKVKELAGVAQSGIELKTLLAENEKLKAENSTLITRSEALRKELAERVDQSNFFDNLNQTLIIKEHTSNIELQDARKELVKFLLDFLDCQGTIGIKRMGEIDLEPFKDVCSQKFSDDCHVKLMETCSSWQKELSNPKWHPFKTDIVDGRVQEVIDQDDKKLKKLRSEWGEAAYKAITNALMELNVYNASGRYVIPELWNFKEGRKATAQEAVKYVIQKLKTSKSVKRKKWR